MPEYDTARATEALNNYFDEQDNEQAQHDTPVPSEVDVGTTESAQETDSLFKSIDPTTLSPELKSLYDSLMSDYTQKTQTLAESRKELDSLGDMASVRQAVDFHKALQDPNNLVQLHTELSDYLQSQGYTKEVADQAASSGIQESQDDQQYETDDSELSALHRELEEVKKFRETYENERLQAEIESNLARQETTIRQANPTYKDEDIHSIYQRAYAYGGDLVAAQKSYEEERQRILATYAEAKTTIPGGLSSPSSPSGETPTKFTDFEAAHEYAKRAAAAAQAVGNW